MSRKPKKIVTKKNTSQLFILLMLLFFLVIAVFAVSYLQEIRGQAAAPGTPIPYESGPPIPPPVTPPPSTDKEGGIIFSSGNACIDCTIIESDPAIIDQCLAKKCPCGLCERITNPAVRNQCKQARKCK